MDKLECLDGSILDLCNVPIKDSDVKAIHVDACRVRIFELQVECFRLKEQLKALRFEKFRDRLLSHIDRILKIYTFRDENGVLVNNYDQLQFFADMTQNDFNDIISMSSLGTRIQPTESCRPKSKKTIHRFDSTEVRQALNYYSTFTARVFDQEKQEYIQRNCEPHSMDFSYSQKTGKFKGKLLLSLN
jgi:hypothetical protein